MIKGKYSLIVKPNSIRDEIIYIDEKNKEIKLNVKEQALKGKANLAVIKFFKKKYRIDVEIISGHKSRRKIICVKTQNL